MAKTKKHVKTYIKVLGTILILLIGFLVTYYLYQNGVEEKVYTNNYTTSVLFTGSLVSASGAAPWALLSLNWLACRSLIHRWMKWVEKRFA